MWNQRDYYFATLNQSGKPLPVRVLSFRSNKVFLELLNSFQWFLPSPPPSLHCCFCYKGIKNRLLPYLGLNEWVNALAGEPFSFGNQRHVTLNALPAGSKGDNERLSLPVKMPCFETSQELFQRILKAIWNNATHFAFAVLNTSLMIICQGQKTAPCNWVLHLDV